MSGILILSTPRLDALDEPVTRAMIDRLRHRGPDGIGTASGPGHFLAHLHFWTTPEEVGERQPVTDPQTGLTLVLDGRIDNRTDLERELGAASFAQRSLSDAQLLLLAYSRWGRACFTRVLGPFAVVVYDPKARELVAARDPLGDRTLFYASIPGGVAIASEEYPLLAHPAVDPTLDDETLARYFAIEAPRFGATMLRAVREVLPGSCLVSSAGQLRIERFFTPEPPEPLRYRRDEEYAEHLASVLGDAVEARLRSSSPVGVSLSGGMDSPSVAALAVERMRRAGNPARLASFSWVFDDLPECDERRWIEPLVRMLDLDATYVLADPHAPLLDADAWLLNPNTPLANAYRRLKQALYEAAARRGVRTLLVGVFSDSLFTGWESWLAARMGEGHWGDVARHAARLAAGGSPLRLWRDPPLRALVRGLLPLRFRRSRSAARPPWLTAQAWRLVSSATDKDLPPSRDLPTRRVASVFDELSALSAGEEYFASRARIDVRDPFRDLRVVRFMLSIPPSQLWRGSTSKYVLRRAMEGRLPAEVVSRTVATPLGPFFRHSLLEREGPAFDQLFSDTQALWRGRVDEKWLRGEVPGKRRTMADGREALVPWFSAAAELWRRGLDSPSAQRP